MKKIVVAAFIFLAALSVHGMDDASHRKYVIQFLVQEDQQYLSLNNKMFDDHFIVSIGGKLPEKPECKPGYSRVSVTINGQSSEDSLRCWALRNRLKELFKIDFSHGIVVNKLIEAACKNPEMDIQFCMELAQGAERSGSKGSPVIQGLVKLVSERKNFQDEWHELDENCKIVPLSIEKKFMHVLSMPEELFDRQIDLLQDNATREHLNALPFLANNQEFFSTLDRYIQLRKEYVELTKKHPFPYGDEANKLINANRHAMNCEAAKIELVFSCAGKIDDVRDSQKFKDFLHDEKSDYVFSGKTGMTPEEFYNKFYRPFSLPTFLTQHKWKLFAGIAVPLIAWGCYYARKNSKQAESEEPSLLNSATKDCFAV